MVTESTEFQEREIIRLLLNYGNLEFRSPNAKKDKEETIVPVAEFIVNEIINDELKLDNPVYRQIFEEIQQQTNSNNHLDERYFINHPDESIRTLSADLLSLSYGLSKIWKKHESYVESEDMKLKEIIPETLIAFKNKKIMLAIRETQDLLRSAQEKKNQDDIEILQERFIILNRLKKKLAKDLGDRIIL